MKWISENSKSDDLAQNLGVMHIGQVTSLGIFLKLTSRLIPGGWVERKISGCRYHFRTFQLELDNLGTKNFEIGSVVKKLQPFEVDEMLAKYNLNGCCTKKNIKTILILYICV